ncbi:VanZ family protein [Mobilitalea sibirica]|uniref:VanZ family protein n=1 Tax=Mobilitalea sibirica TaxID=1462919 RepID=A0A8J7H1K3_9FIRM|nr:VanZ family protein [Mobilitalea sibirica]MBH1940303.1 VanZ family protein [Mobilitalea sibirica]
MKSGLITWLPAIILMGIIFYFSSKPAQVSSEDSMNIANSILNVYETIVEKPLEGDIRLEKLGTIEHFIRKGAHFTEYMLLAITIAFPLWKRKNRGYRLILFTIFFTAMYAASDEIHQLFVPGRSGEISDVIIDTAGATVGACLYYIVTLCYIHRKRRRVIISED